MRRALDLGKPLRHRPDIRLRRSRRSAEERGHFVARFAAARTLANPAVDGVIFAVRDGPATAKAPPPLTSAASQMTNRGR